MGSAWGRLGVNLRSIRGRIVADVGSLWCRLAVEVGLAWSRSGVGLGPALGVDPKSSRGRFRVEAGRCVAEIWGRHMGQNLPPADRSTVHRKCQCHGHFTERLPSRARTRTFATGTEQINTPLALFRCDCPKMAPGPSGYSATGMSSSRPPGEKGSERHAAAPCGRSRDNSASTLATRSTSGLGPREAGRTSEPDRPRIERIRLEGPALGARACYALAALPPLLFL